MYKKASHRTGGSSLYGWSGNYPKFENKDSPYDARSPEELKRMEIEYKKKHKQFRGKRKPPSEEELKKMIEDFYKK